MHTLAGDPHSAHDGEVAGVVGRGGGVTDESLSTIVRHISLRSVNPNRIIRRTVPRRRGSAVGLDGDTGLEVSDSLPVEEAFLKAAVLHELGETCRGGVVVLVNDRDETCHLRVLWAEGDLADIEVWDELELCVGDFCNCQGGK